MKDILELLLEVAKNYPSLKWPLLFLICAIIVLLWKLIETSVPKIVEHTVAAIRRKYFTNKGDAAQETAIRKFVARMQSVNWLLCLRSMSKYYVSAPLVEVYYPLRFSFFGSKNYYATKSIEGIMAEDETFAVIGPPGSGKSTLLSIIAITYAEDKVDEVLGFKESRLPLFLSLKYLSDELKPLPQIMAEFLRDAGCNVKDDFIRHQLDNGRCIVLLDGLDETGDSSRRRKIAEWIIKSISSFPDNRFIISCRSTEWESARIPNFPCASIQRLSIDEIQGIVGKWESYFTAKDNQVTSASMKLVNSILRADNHDLRQLAETPLLLTIMVILHLNNIEVPERKVEVYEVFIRTLLGEWDEVKNLGVFNIQNRTENRLLFFSRFVYTCWRLVRLMKK